MKEDYLWDRSGEVDTEIEQLEKMLGSLRYKRPAEPLPLPAARRSMFRFSSSWLAAAAALVLLLLAGGLWLGLKRAGSDNLLSSGPPPPVGPVNTTEGMRAINKSVRSPERNAATPQPDIVIPTPVNRSLFVAVKFREAKRDREIRQEELRRKGEIAKEQLIKALEITSEKLNVVQKKIQGAQDVRSPIS